MGIFSKNKNPKGSNSRSSSSSTNHKTPLENKAQIVVEFIQDYKDDEEYEEFFEYNDLGIPLAIAITQDMAYLTDSGSNVFEETWARLCDLFDADVSDSYESIDELMDSESFQIDLSKSTQQTASNLLWAIPSYASAVSALHNNEPQSEEQIIEGIRQIFQEVTGSQLAVEDFDKRFAEDLGIDSLALVEGMMACEDMFDISISNQEAFTLLMPSQVVAHVATKRSES